MRPVGPKPSHRPARMRNSRWPHRSKTRTATVSVVASRAQRTVTGAAANVDWAANRRAMRRDAQVLIGPPRRTYARPGGPAAVTGSLASPRSGPPTEPKISMTKVKRTRGQGHSAARSPTGRQAAKALDGQTRPCIRGSCSSGRAVGRHLCLISGSHGPGCRSRADRRSSHAPAAAQAHRDVRGDLVRQERGGRDAVQPVSTAPRSLACSRRRVLRLAWCRPGPMAAAKPERRTSQVSRTGVFRAGYRRERLDGGLGHYASGWAGVTRWACGIEECIHPD